MIHMRRYVILATIVAISLFVPLLANAKGADAASTTTFVAPILLLYQEFKSSWLKFINFDTVVDEIVRSLAGTIGLIFTIPITALLAAWIMRGDDAHQELNAERTIHFHHH